MDHILDATLSIDVRKFNTAMSKASFESVMSAFDGSNQSGTFRISYLHQFYYFFTEEKRKATNPRPLNRAWKERVLEMASNVLLDIDGCHSLQRKRYKGSTVVQIKERTIQSHYAIFALIS
jgi:hypothetical protein